MSDIDLTAAIQAAAETIRELEAEGERVSSHSATQIVTAAALDIERAVREQIARAIEADRLRRAPNHFHHTHSGDIAFGVDCGMEQAAHIARGAS